MLNSLSKSAEHTLSRHRLLFTDNVFYSIMYKGTNLMYHFKDMALLQHVEVTPSNEAQNIFGEEGI